MAPIVPIVNPVSGDNGARAVQLVGDFVLSQLQQHRDAWSGPGPVPPLFLGVQGPQGCGKSHLTALLPHYLETGHALRLASLSLDDIYSTHDDLASLASLHPTNRLVHGRGQPGTHDLQLGANCLEALRTANEPGSQGKQIKLPIFDKSKYGGEGDRSEEVVVAEGPLDVVIFEGWAAGFGALSSKELSQRYQEAKTDPQAFASSNLDYPEPFFLEHREDDLAFVNEQLRGYSAMLWRFIDCFVQLKPVKMSYVWEWRLQQEHNMKAKNGGLGMSDDEVKAFIARYMPGYELFLEGIQSDEARWKGHGLKLIVGKSREITATQEF
ncbi:hypothetical protein BCR35DRAFT_296628 [Leucosporidium creatinivorum]|uniref:P-loop containing nucleoside triphosphate hydrolase protein n=1 Tax=Leucosporidium creatinivorum TaxID=106004 RepID=A0A1Y2D727_9BASI|nr:hypothetical protein BCR35DRAFT_296628 [Leucosporidium creatinivorum]